MNNFPTPKKQYAIDKNRLEKDREWVKLIKKNPTIVIELDTLELRPTKYK